MKPLMVGIIFLFSIFLFFFPFKSEKKDLKFETFFYLPEKNKIEEYFEKKLLSKDIVFEGEEEIVEDFKKLNEDEFLRFFLGGKNFPSPMFGEIKGKIFQFISRNGIEAYKNLGLKLRENFINSIDEFFHLFYRENKKDILDFLSKIYYEKDKKEIIEWSGVFIPEAFYRGLIKRNGEQDRGFKLILAILFISRWYSFMEEGYNYEDFLSPFEKFTLFSWKVEREKGLSVERREELIEKIVKIQPDYPSDIIKGIVYFKEGLFQKAFESFNKIDRNSLKPDKISH